MIKGYIELVEKKSQIKEEIFKNKVDLLEKELGPYGLMMDLQQNDFLILLLYVPDEEWV